MLLRTKLKMNYANTLMMNGMAILLLRITLEVYHGLNLRTVGLPGEDSPISLFYSHFQFLPTVRTLDNW